MRRLRVRGPRAPEAATFRREEDRHVRVEDRPHVLHDDWREARAVAHARQVAAQRVERSRSTFAIRRRQCVRPHSVGESRHDDRDQQHHGERWDVLEIGDGEAQIGRYTEEIERQYAEGRGDERRDVLDARGHEDDPHQVDHDDVGELEVWARQASHDGRDAHDERRERIRAKARSMRRASRRRLGGHGLAASMEARRHAPDAQIVNPSTRLLAGVAIGRHARCVRS